MLTAGEGRIWEKETHWIRRTWLRMTMRRMFPQISEVTNMSTPSQMTRKKLTSLCKHSKDIWLGPPDFGSEKAGQSINESRTKDNFNNFRRTNTCCQEVSVPH
jgi:hypothetical protein